MFTTIINVLNVSKQGPPPQPYDQPHIGIQYLFISYIISVEYE